MFKPPQRRHVRQQLVLKVEFDDPEGFRSLFLSDLSEGGLRLGTAMDVGQRVTLNISFLGFVDPVQIDAIVKWSIPADQPDGPASGLAFVDLNEDAQMWIHEILDASTNLVIASEEPSRVLLLEVQPFLREIYGQEVRNWSELRDEEPLELICLEDPAAWLEEATTKPATLGIIDVDDLKANALDLYKQVRSRPVSADLPVIILGAPERIATFLELHDELMFVLRKPLRFGVLMNTVRVLARDPRELAIRRSTF